MFHVSLLRPATAPSIGAYSFLPNLTEGLVWTVEPAHLLGVRFPTSSCASRPQVLIQWKGLSELDATWEEFDNIQQQFLLSTLRTR